MHHKKIPFSLILTLVRLCLSPLLLPFLIVYLLPSSYLVVRCFVALFFAGLALTDFFDGYYARRYHQETMLGKLFDPLADKILMLAALIGLLVIEQIYFFWVIVLISRDFLVTGLRLAALEEKREPLSVSWLGKLKTVVLVAYVIIALLNASPLPDESLEVGEIIFLTIALVLSLGSALHYSIAYRKQVAENDRWR